MSTQSGCPLHVLIIDDQKTMRSIIKGMLRTIGITSITAATSGEEALAYLIDGNCRFPDVIISDLHMENMDGIEFCNTVRRNKDLKNKGVPILILTGDKDPLLHEVSKQVGALTVLTKPITAEALKLQIEEAVGYSFA